MSAADPFTMPDVRARHARGANRHLAMPIHRRSVYEGPLPDPRLPPAWMLAAAERPRGWLAEHLRLAVIVLAGAALLVAGLVAL
jgi:hypothetical protein